MSGAPSRSLITLSTSETLGRFSETLDEKISPLNAPSQTCRRHFGRGSRVSRPLAGSPIRPVCPADPATRQRSVRLLFRATVTGCRCTPCLRVCPWTDRDRVAERHRSLGGHLLGAAGSGVGARDEVAAGGIDTQDPCCRERTQATSMKSAGATRPYQARELSFVVWMGVMEAET